MQLECPFRSDVTVLESVSPALPGYPASPVARPPSDIGHKPERISRQANARWRSPRPSLGGGLVIRRVHDGRQLHNSMRRGKGGSTNSEETGGRPGCSGVHWRALLVDETAHGTDGYVCSCLPIFDLSAVSSMRPGAATPAETTKRRSTFRSGREKLSAASPICDRSCREPH